jgi:hypothetical protein
MLEVRREEVERYVKRTEDVEARSHLGRVNSSI